jgi:hypothetical protein
MHLPVPILPLRARGRPPTHAAHRGLHSPLVARVPVHDLGLVHDTAGRGIGPAGEHALWRRVTINDAKEEHHEGSDAQ